MKTLSIQLKDEAATQSLGEVFAVYLKGGILYLKGDLGAGKTCFSQALIRACGYQGRVKSPTYTLVEPYELIDRNIYHFDLYRLEDAEELLFLGCDEYFVVACEKEVSLCLIEWPEKAGTILPLPDIELRIEHADNLDANKGRVAQLKAHSLFGEQTLNAMQTELQTFTPFT
jgi:tRNA threonylcarbamoyladenosine biosynthesis protein TsaE